MTKVAAFYQFRRVADAAALRDEVESLCAEAGIFGTVIVAPEGINGTLAGTAAGIDAVMAALAQKFPGLDIKYSRARNAHFDRLKVKLKPEIVTLGRAEADPLARTATTVAPADWHAILDDPDIVLIDARKGFETEMGTFPGALNTALESFRAFPDFVAARLDAAKHRKIAMFCTGGIRCEKASAYMLAMGFEQVFQLQGGILRYLEEVPAEQSRFVGECFVFDRRVALGQGLSLPGESSKPNVHPNLLDSARGNDAE